MARLLLLVLINFICCQALLGNDQAVAVEGKTLCHGAKHPGVKLELKELDLIDPDDLLDHTTSDFSGQFKLEGWESEIGEIEPYLVVKHNCPKDPLGHKEWLCFVITIPQEAVVQDRVIKKSFKLHDIELGSVYVDEKPC